MYKYMNSYWRVLGGGLYVCVCVRMCMLVCTNVCGYRCTHVHTIECLQKTTPVLLPCVLLKTVSPIPYSVHQASLPMSY